MTSLFPYITKPAPVEFEDIMKGIRKTISSPGNLGEMVKPQHAYSEASHEAPSLIHKGERMRGTKTKGKLLGKGKR